MLKKFIGVTLTLCMTVCGIGCVNTSAAAFETEPMVSAGGGTQQR